MFAEEQPYLRPLPAQRLRYFKQETRTVDDAGLVQVDASYYAALPASPHTEVTVRIYERKIEILDELGEVLRRHEKVVRGRYVLAEADRLFNPSRQTARLLAKVHKIGPRSFALASDIFARRGRPGQRAIYGLANLAQHHRCEEIEAACEKVLTLSAPSYQAVKRLLEQRAAAAANTVASADLTQAGGDIRPIGDYQAFFEQHAEGAALPPPTSTERNPDEHVSP